MRRRGIRTRVGVRIARPKAAHPSENQIQADFFRWAAMRSREIPDLELLYHVPNGSYKSPAARGLFKRIGQKAGVPDVHFPVGGVGGYLSLYIEFKTKVGRLSENQKEWIGRLEAANNRVAVCRTWWDAVNEVLEHLGLEKEFDENGGRINGRK